MQGETKELNTIVVSTRLPVDFAARIEERAATSDRSVAGEVRHMLRKALELEQQEASAAA